jgi:hypothetical protein
MQAMYSQPSEQQSQGSSGQSNDSQQSSRAVEITEKVVQSAPGKLLGSGGLLLSILFSLLLGLGFVVRSLKNVKLTLKLTLKRDDRAEKKY